MFRGARRSVLLIAVAILCRAYGEDDGGGDTHERRRHVDARTDDYRMCLESFDVHRDKIIKTQDSRDMGAKYLSVTDVETQLDCLKYCCETERCDVFIFEEKVGGLSLTTNEKKKKTMR